MEKHAHIRIFFLSLFSLSCFFFCHDLNARPGDLDLGFSEDGFIEMNVGFYPSLDKSESIAVQPNGKILVASTSGECFALTRLNSDGSMDYSFNAENDPWGGISTCLGRDLASALALQPDGKIVLVGSSNNQLTVLRYNSDGTLDQTFNASGSTPGVFKLDKYQTSRAYDVAIQGNGKIVVAGESFYNQHLLLRLTTEGNLDPEFHGDGIYRDESGASESYFYSIVIQADQKILAVLQLETTQSLVYRFNPDGSLDNSFAGDGVAYPYLMGNSWIRDMALQSDGKILFCGTWADSNGFQKFMFLGRLKENGSLDSSFGGDGYQLADFEGYDSEGASGLLLLENGQVLVTGGPIFGGITFARYNPDGSLDPSFGEGGLKAIEANLFHYQITNPTLQTDGKVLLSGTTGQNDIVLARIEGNAADLHLAFNPPQAEVAPGGEVEITLAVENRGPDASGLVTLTYNFPEGLSLVQATSDQGNCIAGKNLQCKLGVLRKDDVVNISLLLDVPSSAAVGTSLDHSATVQGGQVFELKGENNQAFATTTIQEMNGTKPSPASASTGGCSLASLAANQDYELGMLLLGFYLSQRFMRILKRR